MGAPGDFPLRADATARLSPLPLIHGSQEAAAHRALEGEGEQEEILAPSLLGPEGTRITSAHVLGGALSWGPI